MSTPNTPNTSGNNRPSIAAPSGWQTVQIREGVTSFVAPADQTITLNTGTPIDGTHHPYKTTIAFADLTLVTPGKYQWSGTWAGEGYNRTIDRDGNLITQREGGADIHLSLTYDSTQTHRTRPNLVITIKSDQDLTAQLTNISAFRLDPHTGQTIERRDFPQLPPVYDVTLTRSTGHQDVKVLDRLGTVTFTLSIASNELSHDFPLTLQADNQFFGDRLREIEELRAQGWIVKEIPLAV